jgi:hypothetical protein
MSSRRAEPRSSGGSMVTEKEGTDEPIGQAIYTRAQGTDHRPGSRVLRRYHSKIHLAGISDPREFAGGRAVN